MILVNNYLAKLQNSYDVVKEDICALVSVIKKGEIPDWLYDDLDDLTKNQLSNKIRKGLFLTSFNSVELFIINSTWIVVDLVNSFEFLLFNLRHDRDISKIKNCILNGAKSNAVYNSDDVKMARAYEASISVQKLVEKSIIKLNENCFFTKSNVSYEDMIEASKFFVPIFNSWIAINKNFSSQVNFISFSKFLDSWMQLRLPYSRRVQDEYKDIVKLRNNCAHKAQFYLSISELRRSCGYFSHLIEAIYAYHSAIFLTIDNLENHKPVNFFHFTSRIDEKDIQYQVTHSGIVQYR